MDNPWRGPYSRNAGLQHVLACDVPFIEAYNAEIERTPSRADCKIVTHLLPEPWFGPVDAPVVFLLLNPGVSDDDADGAAHQTQAYMARLRASLTDDHAPHFHLAMVNTPGRGWWHDVLASVVPEADRDIAHSLASSVGAIQYFPYHSKAFDHAHVRLPSQAATFERAGAALRRGATLIVRGWRYWVTAMPELAEHVASGQVIRMHGRFVRINSYALGPVDGAAAVARVRTALGLPPK